MHGKWIFLDNTYVVSNPHSAITALIRNKGVLICDEMFYASYVDNIKRFGIEKSVSGLIAVWDKENNNPHVDNFLNNI